MRPVLSTTLLLLCAVLNPAAAEDLFGDEERGDGGVGFEHIEQGHQEGDDASPAAEPASPAADRWTNTGFVRLVQTYAKQKGLKITSHGDGPVRLHSVGGGKLVDPAGQVEVGELALKGLDAWTGEQGWFYQAKPPADEVIHLFVIADNHFNGIVDFARQNGVAKPDGEDLVKKLKTFHGRRCSVLPSKKWNAHAIMPKHWTVNLSAALALKAWFGPQPGELEPWLSEGLKAELERIITEDGVPRITTIAYENNDPSTQGSGNWAKDVAKLIRDRDPALLKASMVMSLDLVGMSGANYKQMWSFCQFVRNACGKRKGERNKFARIFRIIAEGKTGMMALEEVLGKDDQALTNAWVRWAASQR